MRSSSPLAFPSSSNAGSARRNHNPLFNASQHSSDAGRGLASGSAGPRSGRGDSPLFFPGSEFGSPTPRRNIRGDIHSAAPPTPSNRSSAARANRRNVPASVGGSELGFPTSSAASRRRGESAPMTDGADARDEEAADEEDDGLVTVLWGTTVTIGASMKAFEWFLKEFTCGDRQTYDPWRQEQVRAAAKSFVLGTHADKSRHLGPRQA